mgnify:CR=1 FL=1
MSKGKPFVYGSECNEPSTWLEAIDQVLHRTRFDQVKQVAGQLRKAMMSQPSKPQPLKRSRRQCPFSLAGESYYLTLREAQCVYLIIKEQTYVEVGKLLNISHRSVEYYMANARSRIGCATRSDLLQIIEHSDFLKQYSLTDLFSKDEQTRITHHITV